MHYQTLTQNNVLNLSVVTHVLLDCKLFTQQRVKLLWKRALNHQGSIKDVADNKLLTRGKPGA